MAILDDAAIMERAVQRLNSRHLAVTTKFNSQEVAEIERAANSFGTTRGEFIRNLVLNELERQRTPLTVHPDLAEIVGIRLMLTTLLKPLAIGQRMTEETFDAVMTEVERAKVPVAAGLIEPKGDR
jgi:hypothetical protein